MSYLAMQVFNDGPLFLTEEGQPLEWSKLVSLLRGVLSAGGIDPSGYSGHSYQIGTGTTAAVRIGNVTIQTLGRWG